MQYKIPHKFLLLKLKIVKHIGNYIYFLRDDIDYSNVKIF